MSATSEIFRAYRGFSASMQRQLASNPGEERVFAYLVMALLIFFVARAPALLKLSAAAATEEISSVALFVTNLVGSFFFAPIMLYGLAALAHLIAKLFKGKGGFFEARLALFWALLLVSPLALLSTIIQTALPIEWLSQGLSIAMFLLFAYVWGSCLAVAEQFKSAVWPALAIILTALGLIFLFRELIIG